jgi:hypothetical protein
MTLRIDGKMLGILMFSMLTAACGAAPDGEPAEGTEGAVKGEQPVEPVVPKAKPSASAQPPIEMLYGGTGKVVCVPKCPIMCPPDDPNCDDGASGGSGGSGGEQTQM